MQIVSAKYIFNGKQLLENHAIVIENKVISGIVPLTQNLVNVECLGEGIISPGFIDLQVNGCGGVNFNENISLATLETMYQTWIKYGTTSFLPTLITCEFAEVVLALEVVKEWIGKYGNSRGVVGIHLEGPYISKSKKGIHQPEKIAAPKMEELGKIIPYTKYFPVLMTVAAETITPSQTSFLIEHGVVLSLGHSNATVAQANSAFKLGVSSVTHMFNAMSGISGRAPGVVGAALTSPNVYAGIIADMVHISPENIVLSYKLKPSRLYLVTDSVAPVGTTMKKFTFAGKELYVRDNSCFGADGTLGGAYLTLNKALENCIKVCNISMAAALKMATVTPANVIRLDKSFTHLKAGKYTSLIYINPDNFKCDVIV